MPDLFVKNVRNHPGPDNYEAQLSNEAYLAQLAVASNNPQSEGAKRLLDSYQQALIAAQDMLSPYVGKPITSSNGSVLTADGSALTYFSATDAQKANPYTNDFLGTKLSSIIPLKDLRDDERLERFAALNGAALADYTLEDTLIGGKLTEKALNAIAKYINRSDIKYYNYENEVVRNFPTGVQPNLTIKIGDQNKHVLGTNEHNISSSSIPRSTLNEDVDLDYLIRKYAGTGKAVNEKHFKYGTPGSVERISSDQFIGIAYDDKGTLLGPTKNFTIKYAKDGVHIIPARP